MMQIFKILLMALVFSVAPLSGFSAEHASTNQVAAAEGEAMAAGHGEHKGIPLYAVPLFQIGKFKVTNSMVVTWAVALFLIISAQYAMRNVKAVPEGAQNFWEWLVESLYRFLEDIIGHDLVRKTFWFFATIFIMILVCNWFGLVPGVGSVGWGEAGPDGKLHHIARPILRGANADLNMTLAMAMIFFACWIV